MHDQNNGAQPDIPGSEAIDSMTEYRWRLERTSVEFMLTNRAPEREFLVPGFLPLRESGFIFGRGGAGKGHFIFNLAIHVALGLPWAGYPKPRKPYGVLLLSAEDSYEEMHRRLQDAWQVLIPERDREWRLEQIKDRLHVVDLRGVLGQGLGQELTDRVRSKAEEMAGELGLVVVDPIGRLLPPEWHEPNSGHQLNYQHSAAHLVNHMDALRDEVGATVLGVHHVKKSSIEHGGELDSGAHSGSQQIVDYTRWSMSLAPLEGGKAAEYGLDARGNYVQVQVTKTNYTPPQSGVLIWKRDQGGALVFAKDARPKVDVLGTLLIKILGESDDALTLEQITSSVSESPDLESEKAPSKSTVRRALKSLLASGIVVEQSRNRPKSKNGRGGGTMSVWHIADHLRTPTPVEKQESNQGPVDPTQALII